MARLTELVIRKKWNPVQSRLLRATETYIDMEGAVRAGKSTPAIWKIITMAQAFPGLKCFIGRWKDEDLQVQLKPLFYEECPKELLKPNGWNAREEYQLFQNGSLVYMRSLKTTDFASRYSKFAGLTLGVIYIDQAEELPLDVWEALKARVSQPGYPHHVWITPNPPDADHWIAKEFPVSNTIKDHLYLHTSVYDNVANIGAAYIANLEAEYPAGHVLRRRFIEGRRGLTTVGEAVYRRTFKRDLHAAEVAFVPDVPLLEAWDFGHKHPAVLWSQLLPWGEWRVLGEIMGDAVYIETFVPQVLQLRGELFPTLTDVWTCADPAGADKNNQGISKNAIQVLIDHGIYAKWLHGSNKPERKEWAIQTIAGYMSRLTEHGPALQVHPRCKILTDGFEAGYVFADLRSTPFMIPNIRRPKKDGFYDHLQNCAEYTHLNFGAGVMPLQVWAAKASRSVRQRQRDYEPADRLSHAPRGAGGYF